MRRAGSRTYRECGMKIDYYAYRSGMRCWNAGLKMFLAVMALCLVIAFDKPAVSIYVILTMGAITLMIGKIPWKVYIHFMTVPLAFMVFSGAAIAVEFGRDVYKRQCFLSSLTSSMVNDNIPYEVVRKTHTDQNAFLCRAAPKHQTVMSLTSFRTRKYRPFWSALTVGLRHIQTRKPVRQTWSNRGYIQKRT